MFLVVSSCSCQNEDKTTSAPTEIEEIAKKHASQFSNTKLSDMEVQQLLFEVRAHEQDLRAANLNKEADIYIEYFNTHLKNINPNLAKKINK